MLNPKIALKVILIIGIAGLLFSGYLSYQELFAGGCEVGCSSAGDGGKLLGIPVCVYGFTMYLLIVIVTTLGLVEKKIKFTNK